MRQYPGIQMYELAARRAPHQVKVFDVFAPDKPQASQQSPIHQAVDDRVDWESTACRTLLQQCSPQERLYCSHS